jgi:NAD(P)H-hydrate repair Nnr-like enzyme with NAD(P)H-hydrate dehydratase domain
VTIFRKGRNDILSSGDDVFVIDEPGSLRRCGGIGDILAGSTGVAFQWALAVSNCVDSFGGSHGAVFRADVALT